MVAVIATLVFGAPSAQAADPLPMLLGPAASATTNGTTAHMAGNALARQRSVAVNFQNLDPPSGNAPAELGVELFDGQVVTLERDRVERRGRGNYTWHGRVRGYEGSEAVLTVVDGQIAGTIVLVDGGVGSVETYRLQSDPDGTQSLRRVDPGAFPQDHPPGSEDTHSHAKPQPPAALDTGTTSAPATAAAAADNGDIIDVMVVYSNQTAAAAGATIGVQIQQAVDRANLAYANSGIATSLRLVHYEQVSYNESGDFSTDLNRLGNVSDGYMDNVHALRTTHGADLVSLFVENGQYCGIAWFGPNVNYAFSVVNRGCAIDNLSFAHELGHNIGARHDTYVDASTTPFAYGHGYTYPAGGWRTVMAYNNACAAAGTSCTRIAYISSPDVGYGSPATPTGNTAISDNARLHNEQALTVAGFRTATGGGCSYALSPASASAGAATGSGSSSVTAGAGCAWDVESNAAWLTLDPDSGSSGNGTLKYLFAANAGPARSGSILVGDKTFTLNQASGCSYALNPTSASAGAAAETGSVALTTGASCPWTAGSSANWLTVTSAANGSGSTTVGYAVAANTGAARSGNLTVGGVTFVVAQAGSSAASPVGSLSATSISFKTQRVGTTSSAQTVTLKNDGTGTLTISALTPGGAHPGDFILSGTCAVNSALVAGQSCTIKYQFKPAAKGTRSANLAIGTNAGTLSLLLSGKGR